MINSKEKDQYLKFLNGLFSLSDIEKNYKFLNDACEEKVMKNISEEEKDILKEYTCSSKKLTEYLMEKKDYEFDKIEYYSSFVSTLRKAINLCQFDQPITVYHGTSNKILSGLSIKDYLKKSDILYPKTFMSTSIDIFNSFNFEKGVLIQVDIPVGGSGLWMFPFSEFDFEKEVLLSNDSKYKIVDYEDFGKTGGTYIKVKKIM